MERLGQLPQSLGRLACDLEDVARPLRRARRAEVGDIADTARLGGPATR